jgi:phosphoglycerate kinase
VDLPNLENLDVLGKRVLLRLDLDIEPDPNDLRIKASEETLDYLKEKGAEIIIIAHRGRPEGKVDASLSLKPFQPIFAKWGAKVEENLRFNPGESLDFARDKEAKEFARKLASLGDFYINEAFAASHRAHASIVGVPKLLPHAAGFHFIEEIENLSKVFESPKRPLVFIIGGIKKDKLDYLQDLEKISDKILIGGRLPEYLSEKRTADSEKLVVANLLPDKEDLTINSMEKFEEEIAKAGTIVLSGPMGKYEEEGHRQGTERVFKAVADSSAYKIAGGGDTEKAINSLSLSQRFDWISVGGGAMLEFLVNKTLPGIEALKRG